MIFSHISDMHLGLEQYGLSERENDVYDSFNESIDTSIKDHVDFVIFAGDIFEAPKPNGTSVVQMGNALKRLKQNNIDSFFILGDHDISRISSTPIHYIYHNLGFSKHIGQAKPIEYKDIILVGFDKIRKTEIQKYEEKFTEIDSQVKNHSGHKILVMHQGITEFDKMVAEIPSTDLPKNFSYYAMGHLHDHNLKNFDQLDGPVAYSGSLEITPRESIKETKKGFYEVDISGAEAKPEWIQVKTRPQFSFDIEYKELTKSIDEIIEKVGSSEKKPITDLKIRGENIETDIIQAQISRLNDLTLKCIWRIAVNEKLNSTVFLEKPAQIDDELFKLSVNTLGSERLATFAIKELLPAIELNQRNEAVQIVLENFERYKKENKKC